MLSLLCTLLLGSFSQTANAEQGSSDTPINFETRAELLALSDAQIYEYQQIQDAANQDMLRLRTQGYEFFDAFVSSIYDPTSDPATVLKLLQQYNNNFADQKILRVNLTIERYSILTPDQWALQKDIQNTNGADMRRRSCNSGEQHTLQNRSLIFSQSLNELIRFVQGMEDLSSEQRKSLQPFFMDMREEARWLFPATKEASQAFHAAAKASPFNDYDLLDTIDEFVQLKSYYREFRALFLLELRDYLTPQQWNRIVQDHRDKEAGDVRQFCNSTVNFVLP